MLCEQDHALIGRETSIPGLKYLLDPHRLRELLLDNGSISDPGELKPGYLRYKPGMNCIARYEFTSNSNQHFAYAKAFRSGSSEKLEKARDQLPHTGPLGAGRVTLDEQQIVFSVFPNDSKLRSLVKLADKDSREQLLARLLKTPDGQTQPGWESATLSTLNYKPERRYVARLTNQAGKSAVLKFFSNTEFAKVREFHKHLRRAGNVQLPQWIGGSKAHQALAFSWAPGTILRDIPAELQLEAVAKAGEAIAHFHQGHQPRFRMRKAEEVADQTRALAKDIAFLLPDLAGPSESLSQILVRWRLDQVDPGVPIHGDFYDKQVVVNHGEVSLIDSDNAHLGNPLSDIACYMAYLERNVANQQIPDSDLQTKSKALINGYRRIKPDLNLQSLKRHISFSLFHLTHSPFRERAADWPEQTAELLRRCAELFESG